MFEKGLNMDFSSKKVLIVEDDLVLSLIEERLVQKMGHEVLAVVDNGRDALKAVKQHQPDIVLMDVVIKGEWDGIDTAKEIEKRYAIPIIYISGSSGSQSYKRAKEIGSTTFLSKPIAIDALKKAFQDAFKNEKVVQHRGKQKAG